MMTPSTAFERLIQPPETRAQIQVVASAFLPIADRISSVLEGKNSPILDDLRTILPGIIELCRDIIDGVYVDESWHPTSDEKPKITPYPVYAALLKIGEQGELGSEHISILAHVFIAIWAGVPEASDGKVPLSNLRHVFLEFRRTHLWKDGLESVDTSEPANTYTALDQLEQRFKSRGDQRAERLSPIRRLLGLSLQKESLVERRTRVEREDATETGESENLPGSDFEMERVQIDAEESDEADLVAMIECFIFPTRTVGDREELFQTAERDALPSDDLVHRPIVATSRGSSKHSAHWGGSNGVARDRAKSDQIRRGNQNLTNRYERLTEYELFVFWKGVTEPVDADVSACLALMLVLLTGRELELVLETQLKSKLGDLPERGEGGRLYICYETALWQSPAPQPLRKGQIEAELRYQLIQTVQSVRMPIIAPLWHLLERHVGELRLAWQGALFKKHERESVAERARELLARIKKESDMRLTHKRIQKALFRRLADGAGDMVEAILIAGNQEDIGRHNGIHYYCAYESDLQEVYVKAISRLLPAFRDELIPAAETQSDRRVGSPYCLKPNALRRLAADLKTNFETALRQPIDKSTLPNIHNAYTLYTVLFLFFSTGYRSVTAPLSRFTDVDFNRQFLVISDKDSDDWSHSRIVPLTENFLSHWTHYLRHRRHVVRMVETYLDTTDSSHVFFFLSTPDKRMAMPIIVMPTEIKTHLSPFLRFPLNIGRHFLRSELLYRRVPASLVDAFMGHWVAGREPMGRFSTLSPIEYREILLPVLEDIQMELCWTPVRGLG